MTRQKRKAGHRATVKLLSLSEIGAHLDVVKDKNLDPLKYALRRDKRRYVLRGSIRTDGFRVQLLAFKLRELQDVRYRRMPEDCLLKRLTSTVRDTDYYLQEIRNVITSQEDIERYWPGKKIEDIRTLTLDGGQDCIFRAFAHLPAELSTKPKGNEPVKNDLPMEGVIVTNQQPAVEAVVQDPSLLTTAQESTTSAPGLLPRPIFYNLAVKSIAVYQPNFRFRR
ncbi:hypothetical protein BGZ47_001320 [Haplosporangium gracile]|nr:hypothetical protein BGZ47_001320 [Haplosporangium gracile]